jgi:hypothetical protein
MTEKILLTLVVLAIVVMLVERLLNHWLGR